MIEYNLDLLKNKNTVVNCKTEEEVNIFLEYLYNQNILWSNNKSIYESNEFMYNIHKQNTCFRLDYSGLNFSSYMFYDKSGFNIISLKDLEIKPKNNFKDYGFEADFEGYIYEFLDPYYIGYIIDKHDKRQLVRFWNTKGQCFNPLVTRPDEINKSQDSCFNLKPIKKEWYEQESKFEDYKGKLIINRYNNVRKIQSIDLVKVSTAEQNMYHDTLKVQEWRLVTKEEINDLIY